MAPGPPSAHRLDGLRRLVSRASAELVVGEVLLALGVVALGKQGEIRLAALVRREALVDHLPADGLSVLERAEAWPNRGPSDR